MSRASRWILIVIAALASQGCVSRDRWLDCESELVPINAPAPLTRDEAAANTRTKPQAAAPEHQR